MTLHPTQPWTTTKIEDHENCPRQFYEKHVSKRFKDEPPSSELVWGRQVHSSFENYLKYGTTLPRDLATHADYLDRLKEKRGVMATEEKIALDTNLKECGYFKSVTPIWFRSAMDVRIRDHVALTSHVVDHKTGKPHSKFAQLKSFALFEFLTQPWVQVVSTEFYWTKTHSVTGEIYHRSQLPAIWSELTPKLKRYLNAFKNDVWPAKQSGLCKGWCPVKDCEFWSEKRR